jgi:translation initiation factor IF-3
MPPLHPPHLRCFSPSAALRTVFLCSPPPRRLPLLPLPLLTPWTTLRFKTSRSETELAALLAEQEAQEALKRRPRALRWARPDRDEGIQGRHIILIDSESQKLSRPQPLSRVLRDLDRRNYFLIKVGSSGSEEDAPPLCKIMSKKEVFEKEQAKLKAQTDQAKTRRKRDGKTMELGWATAEGDLVHRFRKARQVLEGGERVNFVIENRQKRTIVSVDKAGVMLEKVKRAMEDVPKVVEVGREGALGGKMKVIFGFRES